MDDFDAENPEKVPVTPPPVLVRGGAGGTEPIKYVPPELRKQQEHERLKVARAEDRALKRAALVKAKVDAIAARVKYGKTGEVCETVEMRKAVEWAFANMGDETVVREDEPTPGAYDFLMWARTDEDTREMFYKTYVAKLLPAKVAEESAGAGGFKDDGRRVIEIIEVLRGKQA